MPRAGRQLGPLSIVTGQRGCSVTMNQLKPPPFGAGEISLAASGESDTTQDRKSYPHRVTQIRQGPPIESLDDFEDGESIVIVYRSPSGDLREREAEFCPDYSLLVDGVPHLQYYLYAPDGAAGWIALSDVVDVRRDAGRPPFGS